MRRCILLVTIAGCGDAGTPEALGPGAFAPDYETSPEFWTAMDAPVDSGSVHGSVQIWYSTNLRPLIEGGDPFVAPEGSVAIKHQDNGQVSILVMIKEAEGFDPPGSDWSYEQRDADGELVTAGALASCAGCHGGWPDTDRLAGTELR